MSDYESYFLNSRSSVAQLELVEVSHPFFTQAHRFVRNATEGITVDLSVTEQDVFFQYQPARISSLGARDNMDAAIRVELGDLGEIIPPELDAVEAAGATHIKPSVRFWVFRPDVLTAPILGPLQLEVTEVASNSVSAAFEAAAPRLNANRTGERYTLDRFVMLRGAL